MTARENYDRELNKVCKWRAILAGQVAGTRVKGDPVGDGYRDLFEKLIILRAEMSAVSRVLIEKDIVSLDGFMELVAEEAAELSKLYEKRFPGMVATDDGITLDLPNAAETMKGWPA